MAQDPSPAFGPGYPHGSGEQEPAGYGYQQPWYPAPSHGEPPQQPYGSAGPYEATQPYGDGQQPWQWQEGLPQQPQHEGTGYPVYPQQPESAPYGYGEPGTSGYHEAPGYDAAGGYGYQQQSGYEPATGYESATGYEPGADGLPGYQDPYQGVGTIPAPPSEAPVSEATGQDAVLGAEDGSGPDEDGPWSAEQSLAPGARGRGAAAAAAKAALLDRARSATTTVLSADHAPDRRTLLIRTAAGAVALGVLVTAGFVALADNGSGGQAAAPPSSDIGFAVSHAKIWAAQPAAAAQPGTDDTLLGSWLLADAVVRADSSGVHAYDLGSGKATWSVDPPAPGAVPCGLSPTVNKAGLGGALFRAQADPNSPCTLLAVVDTKTGKTAWTKSLSDTKSPYAAHVAVTDDKVVAVGDDKALAWAAADGKDAWQYTGQGKFCSLSGSASGATVLLHSTCADSTPGDQAVALAVADGKVLWWRGLNNQPKTVTVLSAEPAVVLTTGGQPTDDRVFAWGPTGDPAAEIPVTTGDGRLDVTHGTFDAVPGVFFQDHTMVTTLGPAGGGAASVTSYDLGTGKPLWKTAVEEKGAVRAGGLDNGSLVLAADERIGQPAHLSRFALTNGQETVGGGFPAATGSLLTSGRVLIGGGKVLAVPEHSTNFGIATAYQAKN